MCHPSSTGVIPTVITVEHPPVVHKSMGGMNVPAMEGNGGTGWTPPWCHVTRGQLCPWAATQAWSKVDDSRSVAFRPLGTTASAEHLTPLPSGADGLVAKLQDPGIKDAGYSGHGFLVKPLGPG